MFFSQNPKLWRQYRLKYICLDTTPVIKEFYHKVLPGFSYLLASRGKALLLWEMEDKNRISLQFVTARLLL